MILSSSDGGKTWGKNVCQSKENLISIHFASPSVAYIIGTLGTLLQSSDNGNTWNALNVGKPYLFSGISFLNANKGYLLIDGNLILKTITGGL